MELDDAEKAEFVSATVADLIDAITAREAGTDSTGRQLFTTKSPDWWMEDRTFGGMVVAQALNAAMQTAPSGFDLHSLHGYFLRPTPPSVETIHAVDRIRDGRSFSGREVVSEVDGKQTLRLACSFHAPEPGDEYQLPMGPGLLAPDEVEWFVNPFDAPFPFEIREIGATEQRSDGTFQSTRRCWFRTEERLPDDPMIHACLLTYFSDMTGSSFRPLSLGTWGMHTDASLDHSVWFHRPGRADVWNLFDIHALVNAGGRATIRATMHGEDGTLHLSMAQELLIRELETPLVFETPPWLERAPGGDDDGTA